MNNLQNEEADRDIEGQGEMSYAEKRFGDQKTE